MQLNNITDDKNRVVDVHPIEDIKDERFTDRLNGMYAELARLIKSDMAINQSEKTLFSVYKKEDVIKWIRQPSKYQYQLIELSKFLYGASTHYRRLIGYFADMGVDSAWGLSIYGTSYSKKTMDAIKFYYNNTLYLIDKMNIPHEYNRIKKSLWTEGIYYGYEYEEEDSYFIKKLNQKYCRINGIEDGAYVFEFDFSYFDSHKYELESASEEFKIKYKRYQDCKKDRSSDISARWQDLSSNKTICLKFDESLDYTFPPFMGLFLDIYDIQDYKELKKVKEELENYMLIVAKIPLYDKDKEPEQFLLDMDNAIKYGRQIINTVPKEVGFVISPFEKIEAIGVSENSTREKNAVSDAEKSFWDASGVNQNIFSGEATTEGTLQYSVKGDESSLFSINRQFERWVNRKIKKDQSIKEKFGFYFLDITVYNQKEKIRGYQELVTIGAPVKLELLAASGISPSRVQQKFYIEKDMLDLNKLFEPPLTSNVMSGNAGAPTNEEKGGVTNE